MKSQKKRSKWFYNGSHFWRSRKQGHRTARLKKYWKEVLNRKNEHISKSKKHPKQKRNEPIDEEPVFTGRFSTRMEEQDINVYELVKNFSQNTKDFSQFPMHFLWSHGWFLSKYLQLCQCFRSNYTLCQSNYTLF